MRSFGRPTGARQNAVRQKSWKTFVNRAIFSMEPPFPILDANIAEGVQEQIMNFLEILDFRGFLGCRWSASTI